MYFTLAMQCYKHIHMHTCKCLTDPIHYTTHILCMHEALPLLPGPSSGFLVDHILVFLSMLQRGGASCSPLVANVAIALCKHSEVHIMYFQCESKSGSNIFLVSTQHSNCVPIYNQQPCPPGSSIYIELLVVVAVVEKIGEPAGHACVDLHEYNSNIHLFADPFEVCGYAWACSQSVPKTSA